LQSIGTHPSVDELYSEIKKHHPAISKATVYRNLNQLAEKKIIIELVVANDVLRYDGCTELHHHFICEKCGGVFDIYSEDFDDIKKVYDCIKNKYGHDTYHSMTSFFGTCSICEGI